MNKREINIYLSKLISNPKYSIKMYENPNKFMDKYHMTLESREVLIDFFKKNGGRFVNSSILQKIKKMDGLKGALPNVYIPFIFQVAALLAAFTYPSHIVIYAPGDAFTCRRAAN
ncbi:hypothetical protein LGZ99_09110 [Photorhabdus temperata]|uniref:hypothetical protein n=1 Tax=Photorhabdus temperata TaxID=574560 RepID=UPI0021D4FCB8|nr:hypothetical protein [Photorhabdus temperata]MCT8347365.1 hypothetical protein [Photorhabdus temperata]